MHTSHSLYAAEGVGIAIRIYKLCRYIYLSCVNPSNPGEIHGRSGCDLIVLDISRWDERSLLAKRCFNIGGCMDGGVSLAADGAIPSGPIVEPLSLWFPPGSDLQILITCPTRRNLRE